MFSHMMVGSNDIDRSKTFYDAAFAALGGKPGVVRSVRTVDLPHPRRRGALALQEISMAVKADITADAQAVKEDWVI